LVAIFANAYASYRMADLGRRAFHTHRVIEALKDSLSALQDVETGERGYLVNGKEIYLEPYNWGRENKQKHLDNIHKLLEDEPDEQADLAKLDQLANEKLALSAKSIEGRKSGGGSALFEALQ
jgi:CHASE3 domain sensor protein